MLTNRNMLIGFLYARQCIQGLSRSNTGFREAMDYQLKVCEESPITDEEIKLINELENDVWVMLKKEGYNRTEQRDVRKKIAKHLGGKLKEGRIEIDNRR